MLSEHISLLRRYPASIGYRQQLILWLIILLLYRFWVITLPHIEVFFDEAYYYFWSQNLAWGYYSKPPVVAWLIAISTAVLGDTVLGVKLFAPILYCVTAYFVFKIGQYLYSERVGLVAAIIFSVSPLVGFNSLFITTDAPLFLFWSITCFLFIKALDSKSLGLWVLLGVCSGLGLLSKYTFVILLFGLFCFLIFSGRFKLFFSTRCLLAVLLCLGLFSTNIFWNWQHEFVSFTHTREIAKIEKPSFHLDHLVEFLLAQVLIFGLVWCVVLLGQVRNFTKAMRQNDRFFFLVWITIPILVVIATQAFISRAFANWAGPFVIGASIAAAVCLVNRPRNILLTGVAINLLLLSLVYHWPQLLDMSNTVQSRNNSPYFRLAGWREVSNKCGPILTRYPKAIVVSDSRELLSYIGFYNRLHVSQIGFWNPQRSYIANHFDLMANIDVIAARGIEEFIFLSGTPLSPDVQDFFQNVQLVEKVDYQFNTTIQRNVYVYYATGFKGYRYAEGA